MRLAWLLLALSLWFVAAPCGAAVQRFAVIVGNNIGQGDDTPLRYAESDARKVAEVLRDVGGFQPAEIVVLLGENGDSVRRSLITVNDRIRAAQSLPDTETLLLVYFSGHADARSLRLGRTRLDLPELAQLVRGSAATFRMLVLDACRSGALTRVKGGRSVPAFDLMRGHGLRGEGLAFVTASSANEDAQESDELRGSFFTHALVSGLLGAGDSDRDGSVTLEEAYRYAYDATLRSTSRTFAGIQHPTFQFETRGQESIVLTRLQASSATRAVLSFPGATGFLVLRDGADGPVVGEVLPGGGRALSLRPGRYFVRGRGSDALFEGVVLAAAGSAIEVDPADLDRAQYARLVRKGGGGRGLSQSLEAGALARTPLPNSEEPCFGAALGYRLEFPVVALALDASFCRGGFENRALTARTDEYALSLAAEHTWDIARWSVSAGIGGGAALNHQSFETEGKAPARVSASPFAFLSARAGYSLGERWFAALELRAESHLLEIQERATVPSELTLASALRAGTCLGAQF
jgi:hypothetical protein